MHQLFTVTSLQLLLPAIQTIFFFGAKIFNPQKLNVFFSDQNRRNYRLYSQFDFIAYKNNYTSSFILFLIHTCICTCYTTIIQYLVKYNVVFNRIRTKLWIFVEDLKTLLLQTIDLFSQSVTTWLKCEMLITDAKWWQIAKTLVRLPNKWQTVPHISLIFLWNFKFKAQSYQLIHLKLTAVSYLCIIFSWGATRALILMSWSENRRPHPLISFLTSWFLSKRKT